MKRPAEKAAPARSATPRSDPATLEKLTVLGELQCAPSEVALILGAEERVITAFLAKNRKARQAYAAGRGRGLEALRRSQLKLAQTNATMAIFLGKTYLGQADRRELDQSEANEFSNARQRVRDKLAALIASAEAKDDRGGA